MAISRKQLLTFLVQLGLLSKQELAGVKSRVQTSTPQEFAQWLVEQGRLTKHQADVLLTGDPKSLSLGNYTILSRLGAGGMGEVYKARHRRMKRDVAIKVLHPKLLDSEESIQRFQREVEAAAKLEHENIVTAYDADKAEGVRFLVMQFIEGEDLSKMVRTNGPLAVDRALSFIQQAARGLSYAHLQGVIHRDIKPANLMLTQSGQIKVLDMGLARIAAGRPDSQQPAELTASGTIMGTLDYMAPEQALNTKFADARSDIYSLGCTLYFLLTGKRMYSADSVVETLIAHRESPVPSLSETRPDVPDKVVKVFEKMVAKDPADRFQTMDELSDALQIGNALNVAATATTEFPQLTVGPVQSGSVATRTFHVKPVKTPWSRNYRAVWLVAVPAAILLPAVGLGAWMLADNSEEPAVVPGQRTVNATQPPKQKNSDYDKIATGVWKSPFETNPVQPGEGVSFEAGELTLTDTTLTFPEFNGCDFIIRVQVRPTAQAHSLQLRGSSDTNQTGRDGLFYGGWLNRNYSRRGIGLANGNGWVDFDSRVPDTEPDMPDGFLELAFAAVGDQLTLYVNGKLACEATDNQRTQGYVRIGVRDGTARFRNVQVMALDK